SVVAGSNSNPRTSTLRSRVLSGRRLNGVSGVMIIDLPSLPTDRANCITRSPFIPLVIAGPITGGLQKGPSMRAVDDQRTRGEQNCLQALRPSAKTDRPDRERTCKCIELAGKVGIIP